MSESISFDRAADFYDETRALPPEVADKLTEALLHELDRANAASLLEIGIGTGRISRPLMARDVRVLGCDIAPGMMKRLRSQLGTEHNLPDLALADATRLPLAKASVPAALMVHVLHLVASMPNAVAEIARVVRPGGVFFHEVTRNTGGNVWEASTDIWSECLAPHNFERRRRPETQDIRAAFEAYSATLRIEPYATYTSLETPRQHLEGARNRLFSWSWEYPDDLFAAVFADFEPRFRAHYDDLDRTLQETHVHELEVWTFP